MIREVLMAVVVTLMVGDAARSSRWCAARLARWAARYIYQADRERAGKRSEEWDALITETIPSDLSAFCFGASLAALAITCIAFRRAASIITTCTDACAEVLALGYRQPRKKYFGSSLEDHRRACLSLLSAASDLRLYLAGIPESCPMGAGSLVTELRRLAANTRLQATSVALLGSQSLAESAQGLADSADRLAEEALRNDSVTTGGDAAVMSFTVLDRNVNSFKRLAVAISYELSDPGLTQAPAANSDADNDL